MPLGPRVFLIRFSTAFAKPSSNHLSPNKRVLLRLHISHARPSSTIPISTARSGRAEFGVNTENLVDGREKAGIAQEHSPRAERTDGRALQQPDLKSHGVVVNTAAPTNHGLVVVADVPGKAQSRTPVVGHAVHVPTRWLPGWAAGIVVW